MRQPQSLALAFVVSLVFGACAQGVSDGPGTHPDAHVNSGGPDANFNQPADAPPFSTPDAFVPPTADAFVPPTIDAPGGGGSCTDSTECANQNPLTCCYQNTCVVGVDFGPPIGCVPLN